MRTDIIASEDLSPDIGHWLAALGNDVRRALVTHLARVADNRQASIGELAFAVGESRFSISRHVQSLREAGLVETEKRGNRVLVTLVAEPFLWIDDWLWNIIGVIDN